MTPMPYKGLKTFYGTFILAVNNSFQNIHAKNFTKQLIHKFMLMDDKL